MQKFVNITKAVSDENRLRILMSLRGGELCLCQIIELLGLASSTVSKHMSVLFQAGLVSVRKQGRWRYFRLPDRSAPPSIWGGLEWIESSLSKDATIAGDRKKLKKIMKISTESFCGNYKKG
ncbi:MAG: metalloregulator ArsR/SmtB family transcription factor [Planctomycetota bacterium]